MTRTWDIAQDLFSVADRITRPQPTSQRPPARLSSHLKSAVVVVLTASAGAPPFSTAFTVSLSDLQSASATHVVLQRSPVSIRKAPARDKPQGYDFQLGRTTEKLANSFSAYFTPARDIDDSDEVGFVFK